mmetsp:Transcript_3587/g.12461  ORF Transcript_3587/g.12461 Transcript_3587/m.12461 type:complete len:309 (+) Transcript_3587:630-1556(+)
MCVQVVADDVAALLLQQLRPVSGARANLNKAASRELFYSFEHVVSGDGECVVRAERQTNFVVPQVMHISDPSALTHWHHLLHQFLQPLRDILTTVDAEEVGRCLHAEGLDEPLVLALAALALWRSHHVCWPLHLFQEESRDGQPAPQQRLFVSLGPASVVLVVLLHALHAVADAPPQRRLGLLPQPPHLRRRRPLPLLCDHLRVHTRLGGLAKVAELLHGRCVPVVCLDVADVPLPRGVCLNRRLVVAVELEQSSRAVAVHGVQVREASRTAPLRLLVLRPDVLHLGLRGAHQEVPVHVQRTVDLLVA